MSKNSILISNGGGGAVCRCPNIPLHSIMKSEDEAMLAVLLLSLQTEEDRQRFTQFYQQYEKLMFKTALQVLSSQQDAEDVVQSACLFMIEQYEGKFAPYDMRQAASYVILLIKNRSLDLLKRNRRVSIEDVSDYVDVESPDLENDRNLTFEIAFADLPEHYKEVLTLFYYEDLSVRNISEVLNTTESAVKKMLQRARETLKKQMMQERGMTE